MGAEGSLLYGEEGRMENKLWGCAVCSYMTSIVAVLVCIPTNSVRGFPFLHTLSSIYCL